MKQYRFFFYYRKQTKGMTVHFKGKCYACKTVNCLMACHTKYSITQPKLVLRGWCKEILISEDSKTITIQ